MKYFKYLPAILLFTLNSAIAIDFTIESPENKNDTDYELLKISNGLKEIKIEIPLEGNANQAVIEDILDIKCDWGNAKGVHIYANSYSAAGPLYVDDIIYINDNLDIIYGKTFSRIYMIDNWKPLSLDADICNKKSPLINRSKIDEYYLINNYELMVQGPFSLKNVKDTQIRYRRSIKGYNFIDFIKTTTAEETVIDTISVPKNNYFNLESVFFTTLQGKYYLINLFSWGNDDETKHFKIQAYQYDLNGNITLDTKITQNPNLSGQSTTGKAFKYDNAASIKKYLRETYDQ